MNPNPESATNIASLPKAHCFGCGACVNACPLDCIQMTFDREGFAYPQVDASVCNACRKCVRVCPGFHEIPRESYYPEPKYFGGYQKKDSIRIQSSSGGLFSVLANETLAQNGAVYGAVYDFDRMAVLHRRGSHPEAVSRMRTSKYVQSDTGDVLTQVKQDLDRDLPVLFTGTPCQVAGLYGYLGGTRNNLLTIDLVCHGVPSPGLFASHFSAREDKLNAPITQINFRTKDKGWGSFLNFYLKVETEDQAVLTYAPLDAYYAIFLANLSLRPVCYRCKFASTARTADLTLGDFWGVEKTHPELFDGKGTSLILANTPKGKEALLKLREKLTLAPVERPNPMPPNLVHPTPKPPLRDAFLKSLRFDRWQGQRAWKHLQALAILMNNKLHNGIKRVIKSR